MFFNQCVGAFAYGLSLNAYFSTEYYYLKDTVHVENPDLYFGLSQAALFLSGAVASIVGSYYSDYTKNYREICLVEDVLNIIGNIMYSLYYSPYLIVFGQLLIGTSSARVTSSVGEVSRVYEAAEITHKLGIIGIFTVAGSIVGPSTTFGFQYVEVYIGDWMWNVGNMIGVSMTLFYLLQFLLNFFTLHNVSKEYTLKKEVLLDIASDTVEIEYDDGKKQIFDSTDYDEVSFKKKYLIALKAVFRNKHIIFWLGTCVLLTYARGLLKLVVPIKGEEYLDWKQADVASLWIIGMAIGAIPTSILVTILSKYINDFFLYLASFIVLILSLLLMTFLPLIKDNKRATEITLYFSVILDLMSSGIFHVLSRSMLAKFLPENVQSITEGFRNALFELAAILSGLSIILPVKYLSQTMSILTLVVCALTAWYMAEEKIYRNIKVIEV